MFNRIVRIAIVLLLLVPLVMVLPACTKKAAEDTTPSGNGQTDTTTPTSTPTDNGATAEPTPIVAYFLSQEKVVPVRRYSKDAGVLSAALEALLAGPTADEKGGGLSSTVPAGTQLLDVVVNDGVATVNLSQEYTSGGGTLSMTARVAQVVFTATQFPNVDSVSFQVEGQPLDVLGGEGIMLEGPQDRAEWEDFAPVILIESPVRGDTAALDEPLTVSGSANVFEAVLQLEVTDGDGLIIADQTVQATSGTGTRGTFTATLDLKAGKRGLGEIIASYDSPADGSRVVVDEVPITFE